MDPGSATSCLTCHLHRLARCAGLLPFDNFAARVSTDLPVPRGSYGCTPRCLSEQLIYSATQVACIPVGPASRRATCAPGMKAHIRSVPPEGRPAAGPCWLGVEENLALGAALPSVRPSGRLRPQEPISAIPEFFGHFVPHLPATGRVEHSACCYADHASCSTPPPVYCPVSRTATLLVNRSMSLANVSAQMRPRSSEPAPRRARSVQLHQRTLDGRKICDAIFTRIPED